MASSLKQHINIYIIVLFLSFLHFIVAHSLNCSSREFTLSGMSNCHPLLTCQDLNQMKPIKLIASGVVKNIYLVEWQGHNIVMAKLSSSHFLEDFTSNLENLLYFKGNPYVVNLLGHCGTSIFSQFYPLGNALALPALFAQHGMNSFRDRFRLCINYAQIIALLHQHSMVMCDSNSVAKTLTQYLINERMELLLNDLDALPRLQNNKTKCGLRQVFGDLVAPEQEWRYPNRSFDNSLMPSYTERVDIWKVPDICHWILADVYIPPLARQILYHVHARCKMRHPTERPTAMDVLKFYRLINDSAI